MLDCFGVSPIYKLPFNSMPYNELNNALSPLLNELLVHDFVALVQLLYQPDVSEQKLKATLAANTQTPAAQQIAVLLLDWQIKEIKTRRLYSTKRDDIPKVERW